jgi:hypothetical protein
LNFLVVGVGDRGAGKPGILPFEAKWGMLLAGLGMVLYGMRVIIKPGSL